MTTARQLIPQQLATLFEWASEDRVPFSLLIEEVGRVRDPAVHLAQARATVDALLSRTRHSFVALGDDRYVGPDLTQAVRVAIEVADESVEARLSQLRRTELARLVTLASSAAGATARRRAEEAALARDSLAGMLVLGAAAARSWSSRLSAYSEAISGLDTTTLIDDSLRTTGGADAVNVFFETFSRRLTSELRTTTEALAKELARDSRLFLSGVAVDLTRLAVVRVARGSGPAASSGAQEVGPDALCVPIASALTRTESHLCQSVRPAGVAARLPQRVDGEKPAQPGAPRNVIASVFGEVLRAQMRSAASRSVSELTSAVDAQREAVAREWEQALETLVRDMYRDIVEDTMKVAAEANGSFGAISKALAALKP